MEGNSSLVTASFCDGCIAFFSMLGMVPTYLRAQHYTATAANLHNTFSSSSHQKKKKRVDFSWGGGEAR